MTKNPEFNAVFATWKKNNPNHPDPACENCGKSLAGHDVIGGRWGWYCSTRCRSIIDRRMDFVGSQDFRREERQQMGITD